ncbi:MAG: hypothetical protein HUU50_10610 [Candidatus Brocadiae bacterium]|nr:hypothetical protein [Candidatus Brocadiia bacterium]
MKRPYHEKLQKLVQQEKQKIAFSLPLNLHCLLLPMLRYKMRWEITKDFYKYRIFQHINNKNLTLDAIVLFACNLYLKGHLFQRLHRELFRSISNPGFIKMLEIYGDQFSKVFIENMMSSTLDVQDAIALTHRFSNLISFCLSEDVQNLYKNLNNLKKNQEPTVYFPMVFENLLRSPALLNKYLKLLETKSSRIEILEILEILNLIAQNIGTVAVYHSFYELCNRFLEKPIFWVFMEVARYVALFQNPSLFQIVFSWGVHSSLSEEIIEAIFQYSLPLLKNAERVRADIYFQRYIEYVMQREEKLTRMNTEEIHYYLKKAVDFFLED